MPPEDTSTAFFAVNPVSLIGHSIAVGGLRKTIQEIVLELALVDLVAHFFEVLVGRVVNWYFELTLALSLPVSKFTLIGKTIFNRENAFSVKKAIKELSLVD